MSSDLQAQQRPLLLGEEKSVKTVLRFLLRSLQGIYYWVLKQEEQSLAITWDPNKEGSWEALWCWSCLLGSCLMGFLCLGTELRGQHKSYSSLHVGNKYLRKDPRAGENATFSMIQCSKDRPEGEWYRAECQSPSRSGLS